MIRVQFTGGQYLNVTADMEEIEEAIRKMKVVSESTLISEGIVIHMRNVDYIIDLDAVRD